MSFIKANVLIDWKGDAALCDFGLSVMLDERPTGFTSSDFGGTLRYLAPELLHVTNRTTATDVYALGCTCAQVKYCFFPLHETLIRFNRSFYRNSRTRVWPPRLSSCGPSVWAIYLLSFRGMMPASPSAHRYCDRLGICPRLNVRPPRKLLPLSKPV